jgi:hypothetical protein
MKKILFAISIFICFTISASAIGSIHPNKNLLPIKKWGEVLERPSKWSYGGVFGLNFIQDGFVFNFSPMVTYRASNRVFLGVSSGLSYFQQKAKVFNNNTMAYENFTLRNTYYDNSIFLRWFAVGLTFIQIEPGIVNFRDIYGYHYDYSLNKVVIDGERKTIPYVQLGAGFVVPFGNEKFFIMRCMYDALQLEDSPYKGLPIIRGGINIGI